MKGKINKSFNYSGLSISIDQNVVVHHDMKVDGADIYNLDCGLCWLCEFEDGTTKYVPADMITITDHTPRIDWEQRRYEIATAAVQGILSNSLFPKYSTEGYHRGNVVYNALSYADKLIEQLKKKQP